MSLLFTYEMRNQHKSCSLPLFVSESSKPNQIHIFIGLQS